MGRTAIASVLAACAMTVVAAAAQPTLVGTINLQNWIDEAPGLPGSLGDAVTRAYGADGYILGFQAGLEPFYRSFYDKVKSFTNQRNQEMAAASAPRGGEAAMRKAAEVQVKTNLAQVNGIPAIAQVGGLEKLAQMTPAERAQAAQQMLQALQTPVVLTPIATATPQAGRQQAGDVTVSMAIREDLRRMTDEYAALELAFGTKDNDITNAKGSHKEIDAEQAVKAAAIPIVVNGEAGRGPDPAKMLALRKEMAARHRDRATWELAQRTALVADHKGKLKALASAYQNWLKINLDKINASTTAGDMLRGANTEMDVAGFEMTFVGAAERLAKYAENVTGDVSHHEVEYRDALATRG